MAVALVASFAVSFFPYLVNVINNLVKKLTHVNIRAIPDKEETVVFATIASVILSILRALCSCFSVFFNNCYKKKESATISSMAMGFAQELPNIRVTGMKNLHQN